MRRHAEYLRDWFGREAGWNLQVERQCARLYKRPATLDDATRGLPEFDQDRYVLLCLACAVLERAESQITLRALGERLLGSSGGPRSREPGDLSSPSKAPANDARWLACVAFCWNSACWRASQAMKRRYVNQSGDVLYDVHRRVLARLPARNARSKSHRHDAA